MIRLSHSAVALMVAVSFAGAASASEVTTTSSTLGTTNLTSIPRQVSADGVNASFSAQTPGDSGMQVDGDGIFLNEVGEIVKVTFDTNVTVTGYRIGFNNSGVAGNIEFYVDDGTSYFENGITAGFYSLATPLAVDVGSVLTINGNVDDVSQLNGLAFVVPEPSSLGLLTAACVGANALGRRRRRA